MIRKLYTCLILVIALGSALQAEEIDYGADAVNSLQERQDMIKGGRDDYNYLALKNHKGPSGVPLGGIGTGCFDIAPNGSFTRIALNNTHERGVLKNVKASFIAYSDGSDTKLLQLNGHAGLKPIDNITYQGLFPTVRADYGNGITLHAYSGLVPHNIKDSSLPVAWIDVKISNAASEEKDFSIAFSWEDIITRGLLDYKDISIFNETGNDAWGQGRVQATYPEKGLNPIDRAQTYASPIRVGKYIGVLQSTDPIKPAKATFQNYIDNVAILAEKTSAAEITFLPEWNVNDTSVWNEFTQTGKFKSSFNTQPLHQQGDSNEKASVVAIKTRLKPAQSKTVRFMLVWYQAELKIDRETADPLTYFGSADYGRYYHNYFDDIKSVISYASKNRARILEQTEQWHQPILASTLPDWLKFKLINSGYVIYTNCILNKAGDFTSMEGLMGGLAGTMDQRLSSHPFYHKLFTEVDRSELELFGHSPGSQGQILHFDGHYYMGLSSRDGKTPAPEGWMVDNTGSWLVQLAKDYQLTGDLEYLEQFRDSIKSSVAFLKYRTVSDIEITTGPTTYDDFWHPEIYAYTATTYPAFMDAAAILGKALGEDEFAQDCLDQRDRSIQDAQKYLWNGRFFAYGCNPDGTNRRDDIMFSGQLAGQFVSRYCQWNENFPMDMSKASIVAQLKTNISNSVDYYAPKVWNIAANRPEEGNWGKSTCWPFYLESYTAMAAIQAGFVQDGLDIMKHIQLVNFRNGWTWTQNLWQPDEATYMTAPVTWFITDVLASAGVDVTSNTLYLAPVVMDDQELVKIPLFYPKFWATVTVDKKNSEINFEVTKTFGKDQFVIDKIVCRPVGQPYSQQKTFEVKPFTIRSGNTLNFSKCYMAMTNANIEQPILDKIQKADFRYYQPPQQVGYPEITASDDIIVDSVEVVLKSDSDQIYYTLDNSDPKVNGKRYNVPITLKEDATVKAVAFRDGQYSPVQKRVFKKRQTLKPDLSSPIDLTYKLYKGSFRVLPDFDSLSVDSSGKAQNLDVRQFGLSDHFAVVYNGSIKIDSAGTYTFKLSSDDGSRFTIADQVLSNDGVHGSNIVESFVLPMKAGVYSVKIEYFENEGGELLDLSCQDTNGQNVPLF